MIRPFLGVGVLVAVLAALSPAASADDLSGTWVAKGPQIAVLIQIVATDGGNLSGRYEQVVLQADGSLARMDATVTGSTDGHTIVLTIKPAEWLAGSFIASGTLNGSVLHLSGGGYGGSLALDLAKSDDADFRSQADALANQSEQMIAAQKAEEDARQRAKADAERLAMLQDLTRRLLDFTAHADAQLPKFPPMQQRYRSITEWMRRALSREQALGGADASFARGQIAFDIGQAGFQSDQLQFELRSNKQDFESVSAPLISLLADAINSCHVHARDSNESGSDKAACHDLTDAANKFGSDVEALTQAFANAETVWETERAQQEKLVQTAQNASN